MIDRRQGLMVHAPAIVHVVVERDLDDLGAGVGAVAALQRAGEIDPVEAEDHVGLRRVRRGRRRPANIAGRAEHAADGRSGRRAPIFRSVRTARAEPPRRARRARPSSPSLRDTRPDQDQRTLGARAAALRPARDRIPVGGAAGDRRA